MIKLCSYSTLLFTCLSSGFAQSIVIAPKTSTIEADITATADNFTASLIKYNFKIDGDLEKHQLNSFDFDWDFADLETGNRLKDKKICKWLEKSNKGQFILKSFLKNKDGTMWAKGTLSINAESKEVKFPCEIEKDKLSKNTTISGALTIDTRDYQLPIITHFKIFKVSPLVKIRFKLNAQQK